MLTRLRVKGFKNLADVEVFLGPFTCIAGENAVGKSNLFDAIRFLSSLVDFPIIEAAMAVRDEVSRSTDVRSLLYTTSTKSADVIAFEADAVIPHFGEDDLGQPARASVSFLRYTLELAYRNATKSRTPSFEILKEDVSYIKKQDTGKYLPFKPTETWIRSALLIGPGRASPFISTDTKNNQRTVRLHQDGNQGRAKEFKANTLPRTVLSTVNATENPTALLLKREMQSWQLLQLEPSALRAPNPFTAPPKLGPDGANLAATLSRLCSTTHKRYPDPEAWISNRLAELVPEIRSVRVDRDEVRQLMTVVAEMKDGTIHSARSLSDGTLRFLALAVLEADPTSTGVVCLEEPENGIHPERIPSMLRMLSDLCVSKDEPVGDDNPMRQVIVSTHSPVLVAQVPDESIVFAQRTRLEGLQTSVIFRPLSDTWRTEVQQELVPVSKGVVLRFLQPIVDVEQKILSFDGRQRVVDRDDLQPRLPY